MKIDAYENTTYVNAGLDDNTKYLYKNNQYYKVNSEQTNRTLLENGKSYNITLDNSADRDWFKLDMASFDPKTTSIGIKVSGIQSGDDYDLLVIDVDGNVIGKSVKNSNGNEEVALTYSLGKKYYVGVMIRQYGAATHTAMVSCSANMPEIVDLAPGEVYLSDLLLESGATRSGSSISLVVEGVSRAWSGFATRIVNGREAVSVSDFSNALVPAWVIERRLIAMNDLYSGGVTVASIPPTDIVAMSTLAVAVLGMNTENVKFIQKALKAAGCWIDANGNPSSADSTGYYGTTTRASVIKYQIDIMQLDLGLMFPTGHVPSSRTNIYSEAVAMYHLGFDDRTARDLSGQRLGNPSITLNTPSSGILYNGTIRITATGINCDHIAAFVNGVSVSVKNGNDFSFVYPVTSDGIYNIYVKGSNFYKSTGAILVASGIVTIQALNPAFPN